jgi:hypothetical protein
VRGHHSGKALQRRHRSIQHRRAAGREVSAAQLGAAVLAPEPGRRAAYAAPATGATARNPGARLRIVDPRDQLVGIQDLPLQHHRVARIIQPPHVRGDCHVAARMQRGHGRALAVSAVKRDVMVTVEGIGLSQEQTLALLTKAMSKI